MALEVIIKNLKTVACSKITGHMCAIHECRYVLPFWKLSKMHTYLGRYAMNDPRRAVLRISGLCRWTDRRHSSRRSQFLKERTQLTYFELMKYCVVWNLQDWVIARCIRRKTNNQTVLICACHLVQVIKYFAQQTLKSCIDTFGFNESASRRPCLLEYRDPRSFHQWIVNTFRID
jgi:hypothetical protein